VWIMFKFKGIQHKFVTFLIISLIIFSFFSFYLAFNGKDISVKNFSDVENIAQIYFSWLGNAFSNMKSLTTNAIKMDWEGNNSVRLT